MKRKAKISRKTKETSISVEVNIDGKGKYKIDTGIGFLKKEISSNTLRIIIKLKKIKLRSIILLVKLLIIYFS